MDSLYRRTFEKVVHELADSMEEEVKTEVKRIKANLKMKQRKGGVGIHQWSPVTYKPEKGNEGSTLSKQRRNWIGRAKKLQQLMQNRDLAQVTRTTEGLALFKKLFGRTPTDSDQHHVVSKYLREEVEQRCDEDAKEKDKAKNDRLNRWKGKMRSGVSAISKWLKNATAEMPPVLRWEGKESQTRTEAISFIKAHWQKVWRNISGREREKKRAESIELIAKEFEKRAREMVWEAPTQEETTKALKKVSGSAGADGWTSQEVKCLPEEAMIKFHRLARRWEAVGRPPTAMRESRQVNLSKPGKVENGKLNAEHTRPINVASVWWRAWATSWVTGAKVSEWRDKHIPKEVVGGKGSKGAEEVGADLLDAFAEYGYMATLDYSLCYDHQDPAVTLEVMRRTGWPEGLTSVLEGVWCNQRRWIMWDRHIDPEPLETGLATAQGDPWGPFVLNLWMAAGHWKVEERERAKACEEEKREWTTVRRRKTKIYMDDRTWVDRTAAGIVSGVHTWMEWSSEAGLKENPTKIQLVAKTPKQKAALMEAAGELQEFVVDEAEILGLVTVGSKPRKSKAKESKRLENAEGMIKRLSVLPVSRKMKQDACKIFGLSKAKYGWVGRTPTKQEMGQVTNNVWKTVGGHRHAPQTIRNVVEGANLNLEAVVGKSQMGLARRRVTREGNEEDVRWTKERGTLAAECRKWMEACGWKETGVWKWTHDALNLVADLMSEMETGEIMHNIREAWRGREWDKFVNSARREARAIGPMPYNGKRAKMAREAAEGSPERRAVTLCAFMSPGCFVGRQTDFTTRCCWCKEATGHHDHIFWECMARPEKIPRPADKLQARLGWPVGHSPREDNRILSWMARVVGEVWEQRYGKPQEKEVRPRGQEKAKAKAKAKGNLRRE